MTDLELIRHLSSLGVKLWVEGDALKFSAPKGALSEALKAELRAHKEELRAFLLRASGERAEASIPRAPREGGAALSFAQERLWFIHQLDPSDPSYAVPLAVRFEGALDRAALARAIGEVTRRHEVLRTTYALRGEEPVAIIHAEAEIPLPVTSRSEVTGRSRPPSATPRSPARSPRRRGGPSISRPGPCSARGSSSSTSASTCSR